MYFYFRMLGFFLCRFFRILIICLSEVLFVYFKENSCRFNIVSSNQFFLSTIQDNLTLWYFYNLLLVFVTNFQLYECVNDVIHVREFSDSRCKIRNIVKCRTAVR